MNTDIDHLEPAEPHDGTPFARADSAVLIDKGRVAKRQQVLDDARSKLKSSFVGIDHVIDELCDAVAVWYTMPEVLRRPMIVNLWGMTGVGKTDLVRRLVAALDYQEDFVEIELTNGDSTTFHSSVASRLENVATEPGTPLIVLFDEIQRFNTLDSDGKPVTNTKFADFWELLSDGRLSRREREDLDYMFGSMMSSIRNRERRASQRAADADDDDDDDSIGLWRAQQLKSVFGMAGSLDALAQMSQLEAFGHMQAARSTKKIFEPIDCSKFLVIISGNLDEAFTMAGQGGETDVDADIFHAFTSKITLVDIKNALLSRFKPEQVARFGNVHLIYTSLSRPNFEALIEREVDRVITTTRDLFDIELDVDDSVRRLIYRNGVFPVQGVRPVFSSVADILETNLAKFLFDAILRDDRQIDVRYDEAAHTLVASIGDPPRVVRVPYSGRIDRIRNDAAIDRVANVAVHEAGHALAYCVLFKLSPLQITARVASTYVGGFTFPHSIYETRGSLIDKAKVLLAGGLAEDIIFGIDNASIGRSNDREVLTQNIVDFVRRYGFDDEFQASYSLEGVYTLDRRVTDPDIEKMIARLAGETRQLLVQHQPLLRDLASRLVIHGSMHATDIADVMRAHGIDVDVQPEGYLWAPPYHATLEGDRD